MALTLESLTGGEPQPVEFAQLEGKLSELWRSVAGDAESPNAVTRACAMTLLVLVEREEAAQEVNKLIAQLTRQNPCRAIIVVVQPEAQPSGLSAWVSAHCHRPGGGDRQVCSEQIAIRACGNVVQEIDKLVLPLTVSGLPVNLWWRAGRFEPLQSFEQILRISNRVMVDSALFPDSEAGLGSLAQKVERLCPHVLFSDMNWTRLTPWRELTAQFFDSPENRPYLEEMREVRIEYEHSSSRRCAQRAQALLYSGWLSGRLAWRPVEREVKDTENGRHFRFNSGTREVQVHSAARAFAGSGAGVCFSIRIEAGEPVAVFSLERGKDGRSVRACAEIPGRPAISRAVRLEVLQEVEIVNQELLFPGRDQVYEEALAAAARMVRS